MHIKTSWYDSRSLYIYKLNPSYFNIFPQEGNLILIKNNIITNPFYFLSNFDFGGV